jgi:hypothetical protein
MLSEISSGKKKEIAEFCSNGYNMIKFDIAEKCCRNFLWRVHGTDCSDGEGEEGEEFT